MNRLADFNQICMDIDDELIRFWWPWPNFQAQKVLVCMLCLMNHWLECYQICMSILLGPTIELFWVVGGHLFSLKTHIYSLVVCHGVSVQWWLIFQSAKPMYIPVPQGQFSGKNHCPRGPIFHHLISINNGTKFLSRQHSSEHIHIWTIGTLEGRLSFHDSWSKGPCPGGV